MGSALDALFGNQEPRKGTKTKKSAEVEAVELPAPKAANGKKARNKKVCSVCGAEDWPFNMRDGMCKDCKQDSISATTPVEPAKVEPKPPKAAKPAATKKPTKVKTTTDKTEGRKRGLESTQWHEKEATFKQTSFLKKQTGLQTWSNADFTLKRPMTRQEASAMISEIHNGNGGVKDVTKILKETFGCIPYVRPGKQAKASAMSRPDPAASSQVDRDTAAELVELKRMNRELMAKLEALAG